MNYQLIIDRIAPPGTSRRQLPGLVRQAFHTWRTKGARAALSSISHTMKEHGYGLLLGMGLIKPRRIFPPPPAYSYQDWIADYEPTAEVLAQQNAKAQTLHVQPTFSIITPVYNPPAQVFIETVESVLAQTYPHWTLYLTDGGSDSIEVLEALAHFSQLDERVQVITLEENLGISGNSNKALELADGDFIALLDHDDLYAPNMLFEVADCLQKEAQTAGAITTDEIPVDIVYFDEDKISGDGKERRDPWFKPAQGRDTLLSHNILMHCVIRRRFLQEVGGFDPEMDGAQDWDLMLRCSLKSDRFVHIPKILYHWRQIEGSAATSIDAKPWAFDAQLRAIKAHFAQLDEPDAEVTMPQLGHLRILWPHHNTKVSIVVLTKDKPDLIRACITSVLEKSTYTNYEIILVDTGSTDQETLAYYESLKDEDTVQIVRYVGRFNFAKANNFGVSFATGEALLFLNNDTEVIEPTWLEEMVGWVQRPEVGIVGTKLLRPDGSIQHAGVLMGMYGHAGHIFDGARENHFGPFGSVELLRNYQAVTAACLLIKGSLFKELGGFDELYEIIFNDVDLCLRANKAGYRVVCTPTARMLHHEGSSRGYHNPIADVIRGTVQMWPDLRNGDPYYNPNLSHLSAIPHFAEPDLHTLDQHMLLILQNYNIVPKDAAQVSAYPDLLHDEEGLLPQPDYWPIPGVQQSADDSRRFLMFTSNLAANEANSRLYQFAVDLQSQGFLLTLLSPSDGEMKSQFGELNVHIEIVQDLLADVRITIRKMVPGKGGGYATIVANGTACWLAIHVAKAYDIPSLYLIHEDEELTAQVEESRPLAESLAYASAAIFPSQTVANWLRLYENNGNFGIWSPQKEASVAQALPLAHSVSNNGSSALQPKISESKVGESKVEESNMAGTATGKDALVHTIGRLINSRKEIKTGVPFESA